MQDKDLENNPNYFPMSKPREHIHGWYIVGDWRGSTLYLRKNLEVKEGVGIVNITNNGWFDTKQDASKAIAEYKAKFKGK